MLMFIAVEVIAAAGRSIYIALLCLFLCVNVAVYWFMCYCCCYALMMLLYLLCFVDACCYYCVTTSVANALVLLYIDAVFRICYF